MLQIPSQQGWKGEGPYLGAPGLPLPPLEGSQVAMQPCTQVVEEDHVERDAHQGVEDTEDLACFRAGCQVAVSCRGGGCKYGEERVQNCLPTGSGGDWSSTTFGGGGEGPLFP